MQAVAVVLKLDRAPEAASAAILTVHALMHVRMSSCVGAWYADLVGKTIQVRDLDDEVYEALRRRAAEAGLTVPELLRREATRLAARPTVEEWLARTRRRPSKIQREDVLAALDEIRGEWPRAGR